MEEINKVSGIPWSEYIKTAINNRPSPTNLVEVEKPRHPKQISFENLHKQMIEIQNKKSSDYTGGRDPHWNFSKSLNAGIPVWKGILLRLQDKISRLESFATKDKFEVSDESFEDTCIDLANYALLMAVAKKWEEK
jgi:hypothetical protein